MSIRYPWVSSTVVDQNNKDVRREEKLGINKAEMAYMLGWSDGETEVSSVMTSVSLEFSSEGPSVVSGLRGLMVTVKWDAGVREVAVAINGELLWPTSNSVATGLGFSKGVKLSR